MEEATTASLIQSLAGLANRQELELTPASFETLFVVLTAATNKHPELIVSHVNECLRALNEAVRLRGLMGFATFANLLGFRVLSSLSLASKPFVWPVLRLLQTSPELSVICPRRLEMFVQELKTAVLMLNELSTKFHTKYAVVGSSSSESKKPKELLVSFSPAVVNRTVLYGKALVPRQFFFSTLAVYSQNPAVNRVLALGGQAAYATRIPLTHLSTIEGIPSAFGLGNQAIKIGISGTEEHSTTYVFPELSLLGTQRRDSWLLNLREIAAAHAFIEQCRRWTTEQEGRVKWTEAQESMVLAIARENVLRFHAAQAIVSDFTLHKGSCLPNWQLGFSNTLLRYREVRPAAEGPWEVVDPPAVKTLMQWLCQQDSMNEERMHNIMQALWTRHTVSIHNEEKKAEAKFDDLPRIVALTQTLTAPLRHYFFRHIPLILSWENKELSGSVAIGCVCVVLLDLVVYLPAFLVLSQAVIMMHMYSLRRRGHKFPVFRPEKRRQPLVTRVIRARQRLQQVQSALNSLNHALLVLRALYVGESPPHTTAAICFLVIVGALLALVPGRWLFSLLALHVLTCKLAFRRESIKRMRKRVKAFFDEIPIVALEDPELLEQ